ncbi:hypothetical protein D9M72_601500 [compost metagenome]
MPEGPAALDIDFARMLGDGAHPEMVLLELVDEIVAVEVDRGVDDRPLAVMGFQPVHEALHLAADVFGRGAGATGLRFAVPFDVENRR